MADPLFSPDDIAALGNMVKPVEGNAAVAEAPAPIPTPEPVAPAPVAPAPVVEEEPEYEGPTLDDLAKMQADTLAELGKLTQKLVADERKNGDQRVDDEILSDLAEESEPLQKLGQKVVSLEKGINTLLERERERDERAALEKKAVELTTQYQGEAEQMLARFPGLAEADVNKVFDWMEKHPEQVAGRMSVAMVAEQVLGYEYLDARRIPVAGPNGKPPLPPPVIPSATIVTDSAMGGGAAPRTAPPSTARGDVRDVINDIRNNPADLAKLGSFGR
jgi:hypothetical protein